MTAAIDARTAIELTDAVELALVRALTCAIVRSLRADVRPAVGDWPSVDGPARGRVMPRRR